MRACVSVCRESGFLRISLHNCRDFDTNCRFLLDVLGGVGYYCGSDILFDLWGGGGVVCLMVVWVCGL